MRKLLFIALLLGAGTVQADTLPDGCYVAFNNTSQCYTMADPGLINPYLNNAENLYHFGQIAGSLLNVINTVSAGFNSCVAEYNGLSASFDSLNNSFNSLNASCDAISNQSLVNYNAYKKQLALVKRLRKVCGVRCKAIK